jgi:hypothetical protein
MRCPLRIDRLYAIDATTANDRSRPQAHLVKLKKGQVNVLRNKVRFILAVLSEELVVHNRKKAELLAQLVEDGYDAVRGGVLDH